MATQTDIPSGLPDYKTFIYPLLDAWLNSTILYALLYGIYTGILAVSSWNIFIRKSSPIHRLVVIPIVILHGLITINFATRWSWLSFAFIQNGQNFSTVYSDLEYNNSAVYWVMEIAATISTIIADLYMIWVCWAVLGRRWFVVPLPLFFLVGAIVSKSIYECYYNTPEYDDNTSDAGRVMGVCMMVYICFVLTTTLYCTLLIIYYIVTITRIWRREMGRLGAFHRLIVVLVESSALYSLALILHLTLFVCNNFGAYYSDIIAAIAKGVAPTLIVGRAAAGHTRPREDDDGSTVSSLHFQIPSAHSTTSSHLGEFTVQSSILEMDIEAQPERQVGQVVEQDMVVSTASEAVIVE